MPDTFTSRTIDVRTGTSETVHDLTTACAEFLRGAARGRDGLLNVFTPHATAGLAVIETGAGERRRPAGGPAYAAARGRPLAAPARLPGHGRDHVLPAFVPPHMTLPVVGGELALGTWQSVVLVDTNRDNPDRTVRLSFLG